MMNDPIAELEASAEKAGIPMAEVLKAAGVASTTFARWKRGDNSPQYRTLKLLQTALEEKARAA